MRRREVLGSILGITGAAVLPSLEVPKQISQLEYFESVGHILCPSCQMVMFTEKDAGGFTLHCMSDERVFPSGKRLDGTTYPEIRYDACPRFGIKYRAPKVRMERV